MAEAKKSTRLTAECLTAWAKSIAGTGESTEDAEVGGLMIALTVRRLING